MLFRSVHILLRFLCWRIYRLFLFREVYLSTFGFILYHWTMLFLCIILQCSSLRFQRAQDHQNQSPDEKVIAVFVLLLLSVFRQSDNPTPFWIGISDLYFCWTRKRLRTFCNPVLWLAGICRIILSTWIG